MQACTQGVYIATCIYTLHTRYSLHTIIGERERANLVVRLAQFFYIYTSVKIIQLNEYGCRDAPCEKSWKQGNPLSNTIKDTSTIMRNPLSELCREGYA